MIMQLMTPLRFVIFLKGDLLRIYSGLEVILGIFCFTEFGVLEISRDDFTDLVYLNSSGIVIILFSCELAWHKFAVLVIFVFRVE